MNQNIQIYKVHHFVDDSNLLHFSKSVNHVNKYVNDNLKTLANRLNTKKFTECEEKLVSDLEIAKKKLR